MAYVFNDHGSMPREGGNTHILPEVGKGADIADDAGKDSERCDTPGPDGTDARGTPHNPHILAATGLNPGGLRYPQTSHTQLSRPSSPLSISTNLSDALGLPGPVTWSVTFGEDLNRPA